MYTYRLHDDKDDNPSSRNDANYKPGEENWKDPHLTTYDTKVTIEYGQLLTGQVCKNTVGDKQGSLIHVIFLDKVVFSLFIYIYMSIVCVFHFLLTVITIGYKQFPNIITFKIVTLS